MLATLVLALAAIQPPAGVIGGRIPGPSDIVDRVHSLHRQYQNLLQRAAASERETQDTLESIDKKLQDIKDKVEQIEKLKKSKQK